MTEVKPTIELIESIENSFNEILEIIKAMGNKKRLKILITLLTGEKSFNTLKAEIKLQKTALSNHLTFLMKNSLIEKPDHGQYKLTSDGNLFIRTFEVAFNQSEMAKKKQIEIIRRRQFSEIFIESFFERK